VFVAVTIRSPLSVEEGDRSLLLSWLSSPALAPAMALRARIVLASAGGQSVRAVAKSVGVSIDTVCLWRRRYRLEGIDGLRSRSLPGRPRRIRGKRVAAIVRAARAIEPSGDAPSVTAVSRETGVSRASVLRVWDRYGVARTRAGDTPPGRSSNPSLPAGTIVAIYLRLPLRALVRVWPGVNRAAVEPRGASRAPRRRPSGDGEAARAIVTALEAFSAETARGTSPSAAPLDSGLEGLLQRMAAALPDAPLEIVAGPWAPVEGPARRRARRAGAPAAHRFVRTRTRGQWLAAAATWLRGAPAEQEQALNAALGHLGDYFATWRRGGEAFLWTHDSRHAEDLSELDLFCRA
jgi:transposase